MLTARPSRNQKHEFTTQSAAAPTGGTDGPAPERLRERNSADIWQMIIEERSRLIEAQSVIGCVAFALLYQDWLDGADGLSFSDAVTAAQDLIQEAVERLGDS